MGVYFGTTEITGLYFGDTEITGLYFGDTEIWAAWAEYDGTLPAQYTANGDNLADYRICGASGGVGDRTENLCTPLIAGTYESTGFETTYAHMACTTRPILFDEGEITISVSQGLIYLKKIENGVWVQTIAAGQTPPATITVPSFGTYVIQINTAMTAEKLKEINSTTVAVKGSAAPASYVPYGYEVNMSVSDGTTSTTTPIYVGSDPLEADEYVDYGEGKIYRRTNNKFNPEAYSASGYLHEDGTTEDGATIWRISDYIPVIGGQTYTLVNVITSAAAYCWYNANKEYIAGAKYNAGNRYSDITATAPGNAAFIRASYAWDGILSENADIFMIVDGSTVPAEYEPYVAPTDPPVPLPALPTIDGVTITDYAGQSTPPSRFYAKYKKE